MVAVYIVTRDSPDPAFNPEYVATFPTAREAIDYVGEGYGYNIVPVSVPVPTTVYQVWDNEGDHVATYDNEPAARAMIDRLVETDMNRDGTTDDADWYKSRYGIRSVLVQS